MEAGSLRYCQINDNIMKLAITYAELQDYVASHFHKTVNLGYVDGATVSVSVPIKVLGLFCHHLTHLYSYFAAEIKCITI